MMARRREDEGFLGPLEAEVMRAVWTAGAPVTVRELLPRLNKSRSEPLAYTTVMTVMNRLAQKGALVRERQGRGFAYEATASDLAGIAVRNVVRQFGDAAIAQFVDQARADPELLRRLESLIDEER
jgi:predicted transcriptional regulator